MLHACAARFDVTENLENFLDFGVNAPDIVRHKRKGQKGRVQSNRKSSAFSKATPPIQCKSDGSILILKKK